MVKQFLPQQDQNFAKYNINNQIFAQYFKIVPKWRNFAKSDHTDWTADIKASQVAICRLF